MERTKSFGNFVNKSTHVFTEEQQKKLIKMTEKANFKGKIIIYPEQESERLKEGLGGSYTSNNEEIALRMIGEGKEKVQNYGLLLEEVKTFDALVCMLAHELGHSMDTVKTRKEKTTLDALDEMYENDIVDLNLHKRKLRNAILEDEIIAWENGRTLIEDKELLKMYDKSNEDSFYLYNKNKIVKEDGLLMEGSAQHMAEDYINFFKKQVDLTKEEYEDRGIDLKEGKLYKLTDIYKKVYQMYHDKNLDSLRKEQSMKEIKKEKKISVFFEIDESDQSKVNQMKKKINHKIASVYHPYERLPQYMKDIRKEFACEFGLYILIPKEEDNKILHNLKKAKKEIKDRTVVVAEKLSKDFTEKVKETGVKVVESLEKLPKLINSMAEKFVSKKLQKAAKTQNVEETKEYLEMGIVPDKETKLEILGSKKLKKELLSFMKPKEKVISKENDQEL